MNFLLEKLLKKRGIKDVTELLGEEKETFDKWDKTLGEEEITIDKLKEFCQDQIKIIQSQYTNPDNSDKKDNYLKASLAVYSAIVRLIEAPQAEKLALIKYLEQLIQ